MVQKTLRKKSKTDFRQPRDLLKTGKVTAEQEKKQITLYPGDLEEVRFLKMMMIR